MKILTVAVLGGMFLWAISVVVGRAIDIQYEQRCQVWNNCDERAMEKFNLERGE